MSAGNPSGITDTAMLTTAWKMSTKGMSRTHLPKTNTITLTTPMTAVIAYPNFLIWRSSGVSSALTAAIIWLMRPNSVSAPVATTTPVPRPEATSVPEKAMPSRSPTVAFSDTGVRGLVDGDRLAGERRLFRPQVLHVDQAKVRRDLVAGLEQHDVARDQLVRWDQASLAAAHGPGLCRQHVADRVQGLLGFPFLNEAEQRVKEHYPQNDRRVEPQADHQLDEAGAQQHIDQDIVQLQEEPHEWSLLASFRQLVAAVLLEAARDLGGIQARLDVAVEPPQHLLGGHGMPGHRAALGRHVHCCVHPRTPIRSVSRTHEDVSVEDPVRLQARFHAGDHLGLRTHYAHAGVDLLEGDRHPCGEPALGRSLYPAVRKSANNADIRITITAVASASRSANKRRI